MKGCTWVSLVWRLSSSLYVQTNVQFVIICRWWSVDGKNYPTLLILSCFLLWKYKHPVWYHLLPSISIFCKRVPRVEQELLILSVHMSSSSVFIGVRGPRSIICLWSVLLIIVCPSSFGHHIACPFSFGHHIQPSFAYPYIIKFFHT